MWHDGWSAVDWLWMSLAMLMFWTVVVAGVVWFIRTAGCRPDERVSLDKHEPTMRPAARDILDERYARGELSDEEYRARRDALSTR